MKKTFTSDMFAFDHILVELKAIEGSLDPHQAQLINYLKVSGIPVGLLINFGHQKLEYKRLHHPNSLNEADELKEKLHSLLQLNKK